MKKIICIILSLLLVAGLCACSSGGDTVQGDSQVLETKTGMKRILNTGEYVLYQNIFYNSQGGDYEGKQVTKLGTFTTLHDEYNKTVRYYVWGYNDQTMCCDWQWEIKIDDPSSNPADGSLVQVTGTFTKDEKALDGYWITEPQITVNSEYKKTDFDIDMLTMSATLERVQVQNIQAFRESFNGQKVQVYGRVYSETTIQHPYYDEAFQMAFSPKKNKIYPIGAVITVAGELNQGEIINADIAETQDY